MRKRGLGKVLGFILGSVVVAGAAVGVYFGVKNPNKQATPSKPDVKPDDPEIVIPTDDEQDYIYTNDEKEALAEAYAKAQGLDNEEQPEQGTAEYNQYKVKKAISKKLPDIFEANHVSNEALAKIVAYLGDENIDIKLDIPALFKIVSVEKESDSSTAQIELHILEIVDQTTELINELAKVNEYKGFGLSAEKLAKIVTDVIGETIATRVTLAEEYKRLYADELAAATKVLEKAEKTITKKYVEGGVFDNSKADSFYTKLANLLFDEQFINGIVDDYYDAWKEYLFQEDAINNVYNTLTNLAGSNSTFAELKEEFQTNEDYADVRNACDGWQIIMALFYEDKYEELYANDTSTTKADVLKGLIREYLSSKDFAAGDKYYDSAENVESFKDYILKVAENDIDIFEDGYTKHFNYLPIDYMVYQIHNLKNYDSNDKKKKLVSFSLSQFSNRIASVAEFMKGNNNGVIDGVEKSSDIYRFLNDLGMGHGFTDLMQNDDIIGQLVQDIQNAALNVKIATIHGKGSSNNYTYTSKRVTPFDDQSSLQRYQEAFEALYNEFTAEFAEAGSALYEAQNDMFITAVKVFGNETNKILNKYYTKMQKYLTNLVTLGFKTAQTGLSFTSVLDTSAVKDLIKGVAEGEYDHEYVARTVARTFGKIANRMKDKLGPNGVFIDMTEQEVRDAVDQIIIYPVRSIFSLAYSFGLTEIGDMDNIEEMADDIMQFISNKGKGDPLGLLYPLMKIANQVPAYASRFTGAYNQIYAGLINAMQFISTNAESGDEYFSADYISELTRALILDLQEEKELVEQGKLGEEGVVLGKRLKEAFGDARFPLLLLKTFVAFADGAGLSEPEYRDTLIEGETEVPSREQQYIEANKNFFDLLAIVLKVYGNMQQGDVASILEFLTSDMISEDSTVLQDAIDEMRPMEEGYVKMLFMLTELFDTVEQIDFTVEEINEDGEVVTRGITYDEVIAELLSEKLRDFINQMMGGSGTEGTFIFAIDGGQEKEYKYRVEMNEDGTYKMYVWDSAIKNPTENDYLDVGQGGALEAVYNELMGEVNNMVSEMAGEMLGQLPDEIGQMIDMALKQYVPMLFVMDMPLQVRDELATVLLDVVKAYTEGLNKFDKFKDYFILYLMDGKLDLKSLIQTITSFIPSGNHGGGGETKPAEPAYDTIDYFRQYWSDTYDSDTVKWLQVNQSIWNENYGYSYTYEGLFKFLQGYTNWGHSSTKQFMDNYWYDYFDNRYEYGTHEYFMQAYNVWDGQESMAYLADHQYWHQSMGYGDSYDGLRDYLINYVGMEDKQADGILYYYYDYIK